MLSTSSLWLFLGASVLLTLAPGPDNIAVLVRGISQGRKAGIVAALGFASGVIVHTLLAALGIAALIKSSPFAYAAIRYLGAAYLIWIGYQTIRNAGTAIAVDGREAEVPLATVFRQSFVGNVLNPKVTLFFLAFLPQFTDPATGAPALQMIVLGCVFMLQAAVVFSAIALAAGTVGGWLRRRPAMGRRLNLLAGSAFIALGVRIAVPETR